MNIALIFAGGSGIRYSANAMPKQFLNLHGKAIIVHSIEPFQAHPDIDGVCVVCKADWIEHFKMLKDRHHLTKVKWVVPGGDTSKDSVYLGLCAIRDSLQDPDETIVLIHDGVRPLVSADLITINIESVKQFGNAITVSKVVETVVQVDEQKNIVRDVDRDSCYHAKAPQSFYLKDILELHERAGLDGVSFIDSASLLLHYGKPLHSVVGPSENIKITSPVDFFLYKAIYEARESSQIFGLNL